MILLDRLIDMLQKEPEKTYEHHSKDKEKVWATKKMILDKIEETNFFVITSKAIFQEVDDTNLAEEMIGMESDTKMRVTGKGKLRSDIDLEVAPPFATCWMQFPEKRIATDEGLRLGFESFVSGGVNIYGMFIHEVSAHRYLFAFVTSDATDDNLMKLKIGFASPSENHEIWHTIAVFLQPFNRGATCGAEKTSDRVKYRKSTGQKVLHKIRKIIHVFPAKFSEKEKSEVEKKLSNIDWSHRFLVRGHYRKINGIGKNRAGEYVVEGHTYVTEHEKGPEELPVVKKTRVAME